VASTVPGLSFTSPLTIDFNTTKVTQGSLAANTFDLTGGNPTTLTIAGQSISATGVTLTRTTAGDGHTVVKAAITGLALTLGTSTTTYVNITAADNVAGALIIDGNGVAAEFTASSIPSTTFNVPGASFSATGLDLKINTGTHAVNQTVGGVTIDVPAGPDVSVTATGASLTVAGAVTMTGSFAFDQSSQPGFASTAYGTALVPTAAGVTAIASGDVNGDGFPDVFLAVTGGPAQLWLNRGKDASGRWLGFAPASSDLLPTISGTATAPITSVALADINHDGLLDLIVATGGTTATTSVYLNQGRPSTGLTGALLTSALTMTVTSTAGFDQQGHLLVGGVGGDLVGYSGLGSDGKSFTGLTFPTGSVAGLCHDGGEQHLDSRRRRAGRR
jgi:hypothetical protein